MVYGIVLGIAGNFLVEFFIYWAYPDGVNRFVAFWGCVLFIIPLALGAYFFYKMFKEEEGRKIYPRG